MCHRCLQLVLRCLCCDWSNLDNYLLPCVKAHSYEMFLNAWPNVAACHTSVFPMQLVFFHCFLFKDVCFSNIPTTPAVAAMRRWSGPSAAVKLLCPCSSDGSLFSCEQTIFLVKLLKHNMLKGIAT